MQSEASNILGYGARAPEFDKHGQKVDYKSDVFGIGCIAYRLLTGKDMFKNNDNKKEEWKINVCGNIKFSFNLLDFIHSVTLKNPEKRAKVDKLLSSHPFINHKPENLASVKDFLAFGYMKGSVKEKNLKEII